MPRLHETLRTTKAPGAQRLLNSSLVIVALVLFSRPEDGQNTLAQRADEHPALNENS